MGAETLSRILREEYRMGVFKNEGLRKTFGSIREEKNSRLDKTAQ
jgi:hypothetical protein